MKPQANQQKRPQRVINPYETLREPPRQMENPFAHTHEAKETIKNLEKDNKPQSHTPLNFLGLQQSYAKQDSIEAEKLKQRFFRQFKNTEEETILKFKRIEEEKKKQEAEEEQEKKRIEHEKNMKNQEDSIPMGKVRKNILGGKNRKANVAFENKGQTGR